jgi:hypothetical protein
MYTLLVLVATGFFLGLMMSGHGTELAGWSARYGVGVKAIAGWVTGFGYSVCIKDQNQAFSKC